ncbi:histidyl-tRNA synthetase [Cenarchaeum symbiosum A]|uniref:Histidine--tRNA ligase n=1 Tax=Cenarchaeum symbiosum (strain A) TaxID=414004 RepID=A0RYC4_CENSY|nr:histidyl-tRNA synthetase [Cenarchaeum symbiosum A]
MRDLGTAEYSGIEQVRERFIRKARSFAFELVDPSPIELLSTLEAKSGPAIREEIYHFEDKGGRDVALRFDFTVGLTRLVTSQQSLRLPAKFGSFGGVFRYDEPQKGRYRFFHQWNVEIFGRPGVESEAEVVEFASSLFGSLGLGDVEMRISHRGLIESFIRKNHPSGPGAADAALPQLLRMVDKAAKKPRDALLAEYKDVPRPLAEELLDLASTRGTPDEVGPAAGSLDSWDHVKQLWDSLEARSVPNVSVDLGIVRGLDYYSGAVFEALDPRHGTGALAGGGRYDALARAFGREDMGAAGMAGGVERTVLAMEARGLHASPPAPVVSVLYTGDAVRGRATTLASRLRAKDIPTAIDLAGRPLKKQMESASASRFVIIVGPRELEENRVVLREMDSGTESGADIDELESSPEKFLHI